MILSSVTGAGAQTRVSVGVTETIETHNPYGDSVSLLYGIWSEITGPFCTYSYSKGDFEGRLAESWKVENPTTWIFSLNKNYKFNDGSPVTADDVVHSIMNRVINDPQSKQKASVAPFVVKSRSRRQIHRQGHHRQTDRAGAVISLRPLDHHQQSRLRQIRPRRGRQRTHDGRRTVSVEGTDPRPALGLAEAAGTSRRQKKSARARRSRLSHHARTGATGDGACSTTKFRSRSSFRRICASASRKAPT